MKIIHLSLFIFLSTSIFAQNKLTKKQLDELPNTIENQFIKAYGKAGSWNKYKMITRVDFQSLQKNVLDSISIIKKDIISRQEKINEQNKNTEVLDNKINQLSEELNVSQGKVDNIGLLGINVSKSSYNLILWSIIGILSLIMVFFIFKFKNSNILTKQAKKGLEDIEQEFESYRKKSIEKEQKLRRQLQDEINKQRGV